MSAENESMKKCTYSADFSADFSDNRRSIKKEFLKAASCHIKEFSKALVLVIFDLS
jgi:hypothetical protein